jgi:hypothetical protein
MLACSFDEVVMRIDIGWLSRVSLGDGFKKLGNFHCCAIARGR